MKFSNRKRVLVAGGAGFFGSQLCDRLLAEGYEVLCLENFFIGAALWSLEWRHRIAARWGAAGMDRLFRSRLPQGLPAGHSPAGLT